MASSLLALLDDIATILDDVAVLTKVAAKKTAGVLGDDLALNAQQVAGVRAERELPVVWAVAKGSFVNKLILVPVALLISALAPWAVVPLLMIGGAFLCFEGCEKLAHKLLHGAEEDQTHHQQLTEALAKGASDLMALERGKIKGAIRTDFILSAEIIIISLGTVTDAAIGTRIGVLSGIAVLMTVGVYGLVAGIVKLDDGGLALSHRQGQDGTSRFLRGLGRLILRAAPLMMKALSIAGTAAMFMVGGGILVHGIPPLHHLAEHWAAGAAGIPGVGGLLAAILPTVFDAVVGIVAGAAILAAVEIGKKVWKGRRR